MSLKSVFPLLFFSFSFLFSCSKITDLQLQGDWIACKVEQDNLPMQQLPIEEIKLSFQEGKYTYSGTLKYREAGRYYLATPFLFTRDTLDPQKEEKAVEILQISSDTLTLRMKQDEKELVLTMVRPTQ